VFDLQLAADNRIVAATHGKGVWVSNPAHTFALPVRLLEFHGAHRDNRNELTWRVDKETSVLRYELERKIDNGGYVKVADIAGRNTNLITNYNYSDNIAGLSGNNYYYRLKTVDFNGDANYSGVVLLKAGSKANFEILGNPVTAGSSIRLTLPAAQRVMFRIFDAKGRLLNVSYRDAMAGVNKYSFTMFGKLPAGTYTIEAVANAQRFIKRVIVQ
jgi:hypothetical protein